MRIALGLLIFILAGSLLWVGGSFALFASSAARPGSSDTITLEVKRGQSPTLLSRQLHGMNVISNETMFLWLGKLHGDWTKLKAGEYRLGPGMTPLEVFAILRSGISIHRPITVREGENMYEIAKDLEAKGLATAGHVLDLCQSAEFIRGLDFESPPPSTLEGYLFPDTYFFNKAMSAEDMVREMVRHFHKNWTASEESRAHELGFNQHQVITLASMIEKETGATQERPLISSVFHNRLRKRMRLQSDPTTIYGIWNTYGGNLRHSDLLNPTPWNTYTVPALPRGPIGNPGREAIQAALNPATSEYLFFVSHNDGTHAFSKTYEEHSDFVKKLQVDPKARAGKSWRDQYRKEQDAKNALRTIPTPSGVKSIHGTN